MLTVMDSHFANVVYFQRLDNGPKRSLLRPGSQLTTRTKISYVMITVRK